MSTILIHAVRAQTVPFSLIESTARAATFVAAGPTAAAAVSAAVISLSEGVITAMFVAKFKGIAIAVGIMTVVVSAQIALAQSGQPGSSGAVAGNKVMLLTSGTGYGYQAPQDDRTAALEKKLDRVLEALERLAPKGTPGGGGSASGSEASSASVAGTARAGARSQPSAGSSAGNAGSAAPQQAEPPCARRNRQRPASPGSTHTRILTTWHWKPFRSNAGHREADTRGATAARTD